MKTKKNVVKSYDLHLYHKQGDQMQIIAEQTEGASQALEGMEAVLKSAADHCAEISKAVKGLDVEIDGGASVIYLIGKGEEAVKVLDSLAAKKLIYRVEE